MEKPNVQISPPWLLLSYTHGYAAVTSMWHHVRHSVTIITVAAATTLCTVCTLCILAAVTHAFSKGRIHCREVARSFQHIQDTGCTHHMGRMDCNGDEEGRGTPSCMQAGWALIQPLGSLRVLAGGV